MATRKTSSRKKTTRRSSARKSPTRKKSARKKSARSKVSVKGLSARIEKELPASYKDFSKRVKRDLTRLERQIEDARKDARRRWTRVLRDVSHHLGKLESEGEKCWREGTTQARKDALKMLRRLEQAIDLPSGRRKKGARKKTATRR